VENLYDICVQNDFPRNLTVKEFCKSVYICRSYDQKSRVLFFDSQCSYYFTDARNGGVVSTMTYIIHIVSWS